MASMRVVALVVIGLGCTSGAVGRGRVVRGAHRPAFHSPRLGTTDLAPGRRSVALLLNARGPARAHIVARAPSDDERRVDGNDEEGPQSFIDSVVEFLRDFIPTLAVCLVIRFFLVEPRYIPSLSMFPAFEVGDQLAVEKVSKRFAPMARDEVVVFKPPPAFFELSGKPQDNDALIKRIVAIAGDTVEVWRAHASARLWAARGDARERSRWRASMPLVVRRPPTLRGPHPHGRHARARCATASCT